jgi:hypothetical protein
MGFSAGRLGLATLTIEVITVAERKVPVEKTPVEPRSRRGRRKMEDVEAVAAKEQARTRTRADRAKTEAKTKTALLSEQERQQAIIDRRKAAEKKKRQERNAQRWADFKRMVGAVARTSMVVGPIIAPMSIAWTGQIGFAQKVLEWPFGGGVAYAAAYELTIVFCAWMYHEARKDGDTGTYYRGLTWFFAIANGVQQWWHWSDAWSATPRSVAYSTMTMIGILVWEAYNKLVIRRKLRADGKISGARPRIGFTRWLRYPRISWTAWSGTILHGFDEFETMWTWAEVEREGKRTRRNKIKDLKAEIKDLKARLADQPDPKGHRVIKAEVERVDQPDPEPVKAGPPPVDPRIEDGPRELEAGSPEVNPGDDDHGFEPTPAERTAVKEMIDAEIRLNRTNVADYIRENRDRLGQDGIATKRAAEVAAWGRDNGNGLRSVG